MLRILITKKNTIKNIQELVRIKNFSIFNIKKLQKSRRGKIKTKRTHHHGERTINQHIIKVKCLRIFFLRIALARKNYSEFIKTVWFLLSGLKI